MRDGRRNLCCLQQFAGRFWYCQGPCTPHHTLRNSGQESGVVPLGRTDSCWRRLNSALRLNEEVEDDQQRAEQHE
jgi:hypothetical protein